MAEWRTIPGFPHYAVSDDGRVKKIAAFKRNRGVGEEVRPERNLRTGHLSVRIRDAGGRTARIGVHRAVGLAFVPNPDGHPQVNHWDGVHDRNVPPNLYWGTQAQNMQDRVRHGNQPSAAKGARLSLTMRQARDMRAEHTGAHGEQPRLAAKYGVSRHMVGKVLRGEVYRELDGSAPELRRTFGLAPEARQEVERLKGRMSGPKVARQFGISHPRVYQIWREMAQEAA